MSVGIIVQHFSNFINSFAFQVGADRSRQVSSEKCKHSVLDLIIADITENLPDPWISVPNSAIPPWNVRPEKYIDTIFEFADNYIHDNAALLLFHANDRDLQLEIEDCAMTYDFKLLIDWWALNELPLALPRDPSATVILYVDCIKFHLLFSMYQYLQISGISY